MIFNIHLKQSQIEKALPLGTVLTIPAAGSESSSGTVITNEDGWYKRSTGSPLLYPKFSMLNPELCFTLPEYQIASGSADILVHLMERYFTNTKNVELIDRLIEGTMKTVINNVPKVLKNKEDYDSFAEVMWAGTIAHNNLLSTGRETDWASHNIEHELSGIYDVTHGAGLAVIFPAWMKFVYKHDLDRFNQFATRVFDVKVEGKTKGEIALEGIKKLEEFFKSINLPVTLKELEIGEDRLEEMAKKCTDNDEHTVGHFVELNAEDILEIYKLAL
ncbi:iron-containing alcohol dehydrogenase [Clostridium perfringens]|uniref:iron-containing alcohol dehydrogenase n=1 Tax=Clostridium perfringens TaxID=1502 RepID=UPI002FD8AE61